MTIWEALLVAAAGLAAGLINIVVGSGTLITFPTLVAMGVPPVTANISNNIGLLAGGFSGTLGYRHEMVGGGPFLRRHLPASMLGGLLGALLVLVLDQAVFRAVVPVLIVLGLVLVVFGPRINAAAKARHPSGESPGRARAMLLGIFLGGIYGGYFGAAQGIILMGIMSALSSAPLQRLNGFKNVFATGVNLIAAVVFLSLAWGQVDWPVVGCIAIGSFVGGILGARWGRRIPPNALRAIIVVVGCIGLVRLLTA